ncbi:MAG: hypothetical protein ABJH26_06315, partial [Marinomonas sp.]
MTKIESDLVAEYSNYRGRDSMMGSNFGRALAIVSSAALVAACQPKEPPVTAMPAAVEAVKTPAAVDPAIVMPTPKPMQDDALQFAPTRVLSEKDAGRLRNNQGMTLQWITWDKRSPVSVKVDERGVWMLTSEIRGDDGGAMK